MRLSCFLSELSSCIRTLGKIYYGTVLDCDAYNFPSHHPDPFPFLDLPNDLCRLILSKADLRDRLAAYHTCRPLHHLLALEPGAGFWGQLVIHVLPHRTLGADLKPAGLMPDVAAGGSSITPSVIPSIFVQVSVTDTPDDHATAIDWVIRRIGGFSSCHVQIMVCEDDGIPASEVLRLWAGLASQIGALPNLPPLNILYNPELGANMIPFLNTLEALGRAPAMLHINVAGCVLDTDACDRLLALSHNSCLRLDNLTHIIASPLQDVDVSQLMKRVAPLTNLHLGLGTEWQGSMFADDLMALTGLRSLDMTLTSACQFPTGFAEALSRVTHLGITFRPDGLSDNLWPEAPSDFIDRFQSVTSASILCGFCFDDIGSISLLLKQLPANVSALSIELELCSTESRSSDSKRLSLDISNDAVSHILAASRLTSLDIHFVWGFEPSERVSMWRPFMRSISVHLGESFGRLSCLKSLRVLQTYGTSPSSNLANKQGSVSATLHHSLVKISGPTRVAPDGATHVMEFASRSSYRGARSRSGGGRAR